MRAKIVDVLPRKYKNIIDIYGGTFKLVKSMKDAIALYIILSKLVSLLVL